MGQNFLCFTKGPSRFPAKVIFRAWHSPQRRVCAIGHTTAPAIRWRRAQATWNSQGCKARNTSSGLPLSLQVLMDPPLPAWCTKGATLPGGTPFSAPLPSSPGDMSSRPAADSAAGPGRAAVAAAARHLSLDTSTGKGERPLQTAVRIAAVFQLGVLIAPRSVPCCEPTRF